MPAQRPRASFEPISPHFDVKRLVESTPNFSFVDRINCDMIDQQGQAAFERLVLLHVVVGGKPLVVDGFDSRLDPWTFRPQWLFDNCGDKVENARNLTAKEYLPLTMAHYLRNMTLLTNQFFENPGAHRDKNRQRMYLKDIDCPQVWWDSLTKILPEGLTYLNESAGELGGPGAVPDANSRRLGKGIARAGDLMSSLPPDMRAENLMCYIGHEGTYTPAHREMCASLGNNIMVEASGTVSDDGKPERPGSSIWFMTESKDRQLVSEYWLSVLGHDIEVENHFAQVVAWKKAPFSVYVVEQRPGDLILIPPLAPHQVWNRGTRTMKVAWNRTTVETLEMALNEALPRSRIVCRDEQYKNKAIIYYTLQKYSSLLTLAQQQAARLPAQVAQELMYSDKIKGLKKDFKRLFAMYRQVLLSEMFNSDDRDAPKSLEYLPFDSNVTCAYCRCNIFNRFLSCPSCKEVLGHNSGDNDGDPYDVCMDCYAMGRSCGCISGLKWTEQFRWKELTTKYEAWRKLIISLENGRINEKTPLGLIEERRRYGKKTLADVCKDQLKRRPWKDISKPTNESKEDEGSDEEIVVDDNGMVKKTKKKRSKAWLKNNQPCHVCCNRHPTWKMAQCTTCERWWCYGALFRGWDKMPLDIMQDPDFSCPHCLGICFAGACKREGKMTPYEPKGTLLGHDTKKVADVRSVEALVDFSVSNLNWLRDDDPANKTESRRFKRANAEAQRSKAIEPGMDDDDDDDDGLDTTQVEVEYSPSQNTPIDPALGADGNSVSHFNRDDSQTSGTPQIDDDDDADAMLARQLREVNSRLPPPAAMMSGALPHDAPDGYAALAASYPAPDDDNGYRYPVYHGEDRDDEPAHDAALQPFLKRRHSRTEVDDDHDADDIAMTKAPRAKKQRLTAAGFRSSDLADGLLGGSTSKARNEAQRQFENEKQRKVFERAKQTGRYIMTHAAIKGKKRVVKVKIPGPRLAQLLAQQAAKLALMDSGGDVDAEREIEGTLEATPVEPEDTGALLKSDIPQKPLAVPTNNYLQRIKEGKIVTGASRKVLVPVDDDETYGYTYRERLSNGKRVGRGINTLPPTAASKKAQRDRRAVRTYEEVDIGSDEDEDMDVDDLLGLTQRASHTGPHKRRSLPGYLEDRHAGEDDLPDELPDDYREVNPHKRPSKRRSFPAGQALEGAPVPRTQAGATASAVNGAASEQNGRMTTAGKRPSVRPAPSVLESDENQASDPEADSAPDVHTAVNKDSVSATPRGHTGIRGRPSRGGRSFGRPSRPLGLSTVARKAMEEENRLAKLQALQLVDASTSGSAAHPTPGTDSHRAGQKTVRMADVQYISDGADSESDDGDDDGRLDAVPARA